MNCVTVNTLEHIKKTYKYIHKNKNDSHKTEADALTRTIIVGPSFYGRTCLLINKLQLLRLDNPEHQIKRTTRSPQQYENI